MSRFFFAEEYDNFDKSTLAFGDILMTHKHRVQFNPQELKFYQKGRPDVQQNLHANFVVPLEVSCRFDKMDFCKHSLEASLAAKRCGYSDEIVDLSPIIGVEVAKNDKDLKALCENFEFEKFNVTVYFLYKKGKFIAVEFFLGEAGTIALYPLLPDPNSLEFILNNFHCMQYYPIGFRLDIENINAMSQSVDDCRRIREGSFNYDFSQLRKIETECNQLPSQVSFRCVFVMQLFRGLEMAIVFKRNQKDDLSKHIKYTDEEINILRSICSVLENSGYIDSKNHKLDCEVIDK